MLLDVTSSLGANKCIATSSDALVTSSFVYEIPLSPLPPPVPNYSILVHKDLSNGATASTNARGDVQAPGTLAVAMPFAPGSLLVPSSDALCS